MGLTHSVLNAPRADLGFLDNAAHLEVLCDEVLHHYSLADLFFKRQTRLIGTFGGYLEHDQRASGIVLSNSFSLTILYLDSIILIL